MLLPGSVLDKFKYTNLPIGDMEENNEVKSVSFQVMMTPVFNKELGKVAKGLGISKGRVTRMGISMFIKSLKEAKAKK